MIRLKAQHLVEELVGIVSLHSSLHPLLTSLLLFLLVFIRGIHYLFDLGRHKCLLLDQSVHVLCPYSNHICIKSPILFVFVNRRLGVKNPHLAPNDYIIFFGLVSSFKNSFVFRKLLYLQRVCDLLALSFIEIIQVFLHKGKIINQGQQVLALLVGP